MASSVYKWFLFALLGVVLCAAKPFKAAHVRDMTYEAGSPVSSPGFRLPDANHPFHVSVVEIEHNAADKTLEISCKIFTDDFEKILVKNYNTKVDLINPPDHKAMDTLVKKYLRSHLFINADGKPVNFSYLGFEHESEAVYGYFQVDNIASVKKIDITNSLMHDMFDDQVNLMHVIVGGNRKSMKLDYPGKTASFTF
jgi:ABC-type sugar transport system substrate-binding protein